MNRTFWYLIALLLSFCVDSFGFTKYVTHNLNLRYEPNAHSYVLTVIPKGTAVTIEEDCKCLWVPVEYNGYVGFVSTKYFQRILSLTILSRISLNVQNIKLLTE